MNQAAIDKPSDYRAFLEDKIKLAPVTGFDVDPETIHTGLKPFCRDIVAWALKGGRRAVFSSFGLHKTSVQLEFGRQVRLHTRKPFCTVLPLGVRQEFGQEVADRGFDQLGVRLKFVRTEAEVEDDVAVHHLTNYETIREGKLDPKIFGGVTLDEAAVLRSYGSKTYQEFLPLFAGIPFKMPATATPDPNKLKELIHYSGFLEIMDTGQALTRWFQRDSTQANNLTLYPHREEEFWLWVSSWAVMIQRPSDLGYSDDGYVMPPLKVEWHEIPSDHSRAGIERDGQGTMFANAARSLSDAAREKRASIGARVAKACELIAQDPDRHRILWHHLEDERHAIQKARPQSRDVYGTQDRDEREARVIGFARGEFREISTKAEICGAGPNWQKHCHEMIFVGIDYKFHDIIQALHRTLRYGQKHECTVHFIHTEAERDIRRVIEEKWATYDAQRARMSEIIRQYGLGKVDIAATIKRRIGIARSEVRSRRFRLVRGDACEEMAYVAENSVDLVVSSIPFEQLYEYTDHYEDFGHTDDRSHFWRQMDYLTPHLLRALRPGRVMCIHVKDRIMFGAVHGTGAPTVSPFHAEATLHYMRHGFDYMGAITIATDVVRENNQTYRLGYGEMVKDASRMGVGSPEYVLLLRKPQSDRTRGYADDPVTKERPLCIDNFGNEIPYNDAFPIVPGSGHSLARWQLDANALWRSDGNTLLSAQEFADKLRGLEMREIAALVKQFSIAEIYDHEYLVALGEHLGDRLPKIFALLAPQTASPWVWTDVNRMRTLNAEQVRRRVEMHLCPLQLDIIDRLITQYSMAGETVFDPFSGLGSVPLRAVMLGRKGYGIELSEQYFQDSVGYLKAAEKKVAVPTLFDVTRVALPAPQPVLAEAAE